MTSFWRLIFSCGFFAFGFASYAQNVTFHSAVEDQLEIDRLAVLPVNDNVGGIYSRPLEKHLNMLIQENHRLNYRSLNFAGPLPLLDDLETNPRAVLEMTRGSDANALIGTQVIKGPNGIHLRLALFQLSNGFLLAKVQARKLQQFDIQSLQKKVDLMFNELLDKLPYQGRVLSRQGSRLTISLGSKDGLKTGDELNVVQITRLDRHPKFKFLVSVQKEILGKLKVLKADSTLSFVTIVYERERGVLRKGHKVDSLKKVTYTVPGSLADSIEGDALNTGSLDNEIVFGKNARAWLPNSPPSFGQVGVKLGLGRYSGKRELSSESLEASDSLVPSIGISGEVWITPNWITRFYWQTGVANTENPRTGSTPSEISHSLSSYAVIAAYNFLLEKDFFGPKIEVGLGFSGYSDSVDDSTPTAFTSMKYSGITLALRGQMPIDEIWSAGVGINYVIGASLSETPETSGADSSESVTDFQVFGEYQWKPRIKFTGDLNFRLLRASFTGTGSAGESASSASQTITTLSAGVVYMF